MIDFLDFYVIVQSLLFTGALLSGHKRENRPLAAFFFYIFFINVLYKTRLFFEPDGAGFQYWYIVYSLFAQLKPVFTFLLLYTLAGSPLPRPMRWLWALPLLHILSFIDGSPFKQSAPYDNLSQLFFDIPVMIKALTLVLLIRLGVRFNHLLRKPEDTSSSYRRIRLIFGKWFIYFEITRIVLVFIYLLLPYFNTKYAFIPSDSLAFSSKVYNMIWQSGTALFMLAIGYLAIRKPAVLDNDETDNLQHDEQVSSESSLEEETDKSPKIIFSSDQLEAYRLILAKVMDQDKAYVDPGLSLQRLAAITGISTRVLSQFIKTNYDKNFKEYINSYRIEHAKGMLTDLKSNNYTIYAIALESGFSTESSFYSVFKQFTGITPKHYRTLNTSLPESRL